VAIWEYLSSFFQAGPRQHWTFRQCGKWRGVYTACLGKHNERGKLRRHSRVWEFFRHFEIWGHLSLKVGGTNGNWRHLEGGGLGCVLWIFAWMVREAEWNSTAELKHVMRLENEDVGKCCLWSMTLLTELQHEQTTYVTIL